MFFSSLTRGPARFHAARSSLRLARPVWTLRTALVLVLPLAFACAEPSPDDSVGSLSLSLTSQAAGKSYRLSDARFSLLGPENKELAGDDADPLRLSLPSGAYTLELLPGYRLVRADAPEELVEARLVSENPAPFWVDPGAVTQVALRFSLADGTPVSSEPGTLAVDLELMAPGERWLGDPCVDGLKINEFDYDQAGTDTAEFVEILNTESCDAQLAGLALELVNGPDGKVYARYELAAAGSLLSSRARLVLGAPSVLASLPEGTLGLPLKAAGLQNGPDALRLVDAHGSLDAVAYKGPVPENGEGQPTGTDNADLAFSRCPDAADSEDNARDFALREATPGLPNACE